jgi:hypothetical protein
MKEHGIIFSAPMVLALLDGRKSQTRRIVKLTDEGHARGELVSVRQAGSDQRGWRMEAVFRDGCLDDPVPLVVRSPYGAPGDRLWVKETFVAWRKGEELDHPQIPESDGVLYRADGERRGQVMRWSSPIYMPRWASRLTLELTAVRVEISEEDAKAEGAPMFVVGHGQITDDDLKAEPGYWGPSLYRNGYEDLWEGLHGAESWAANPFCWVLEFRRRP